MPPKARHKEANDMDVTSSQTAEIMTWVDDMVQKRLNAIPNPYPPDPYEELRIAPGGTSTKICPYCDVCFKDNIEDDFQKICPSCGFSPY